MQITYADAPGIMEMHQGPPTSVMLSGLSEQTWTTRDECDISYLQFDFAVM